MSNNRVGFAAELKVAELLPGCEIINQLRDDKKPYDLLWNGIKIDVKGTARADGVKAKRCNFTMNHTPAHTGVVLVLIGMLEDKDYYWVKPYIDNPSMYCKLEDALEADKLGDAIMETSKLPADILTKPKVDLWQVRDVNLDTRARIKAFAAIRGLTLPEALTVLIDEAENRIVATGSPAKPPRLVPPVAKDVAKSVERIDE